MSDLLTILEQLRQITGSVYPISTLNVDVLKGVAFTHLATGNIDLACETLGRAIDIQAPAVPDSTCSDALAESYALLAIIQAVTGQPDKASDTMRIAIRTAKSEKLKRLYSKLPLPAASAEGE